MLTKTVIVSRCASNLMIDLNGKVVLITGAGKGFGRVLAEAFAKQKAIVAANDISPINIEEVINDILRQGGRAKAYIEDVAKKLGAQLIIKEVEDDFGGIDILINHAAVEPRVPLLDMDEWDWHRVLDVNLTGAFLMTQSVGRLMREQGSGVIINLITRSSRDGKHDAAFAATMNALDGFTREAEHELSQYGIHVYSAENIPEKIVESVFALLDLQMEER